MLRRLGPVVRPGARLAGTLRIAVKAVVTDKKGITMSWESYRHRCQVRVRFGDTDPYGIVYFVSYFRYCHRAIEEYLRSVGLPPEETFRNTQEGFGLPIVEAHGKFLRPSRYGDLLEIETRLQEVRAKALIFQFRFFPAGGEQLLAEGSATMVAISSQWQAIAVPERVLAKLAGAQKPEKVVEKVL
ncbi:MAG: acyl-CoA thioesterase [Desulfobacca sp.]|uniref:acyl-CoA thioesterase n=1 Tax=Desulfobacca sp. TaxID=2067990 RepID=UPI00404AF9D1